MNIINVSVNFEKRQIQRTGVNLTSGDYNSTKIVFEFDKDYSGRKVFELANPFGDVVLVQEIPDNNEVVLVGYIDGKEVSIFNEVGKYIFEISLYEENSKLTSASSSLVIKQEQVTIGDEIVQAYLPIFDTLMQDVQKLTSNLETAEKEVLENEELRKDAEIKRENSENARSEAEIKREEAEKSRNTAETARQDNESARKKAETKRENAETVRVNAEKTRNNNEEVRQNNENTRAKNEISRQTNELSRINNEEIREEKIRMIENALKDVTVEGTDIKIQDSADWYAKIKIKGKTEQKTRSGKNLLNVTATSKTQNGITFTINADKSVTINGTNSLKDTIYFRIADDLTLPAGNYTLYNKNSNVSNENSFIFYDDGLSFPRKNISNATLQAETIIKPYIKVISGATINNQTIYPMIVQGTYTEDTIGDYEQYGASPSPEFPSEIENVEGKNLFDKNNANILNASLSSTGITASAKARTLYIPIIGGNTYTIQKKASARFRVGTLASIPVAGSTEILDFANIDNASQYTIITSQASKYLVVYYYYSDDETLTEQQILDSIQIEKGTVATEYVPYNSLAVKVTGKNLSSVNESNTLNTTLCNVKGGKTYTISLKINGTLSVNIRVNEDGQSATGNYEHMGRFTQATGYQKLTFTPTQSGILYLNGFSDTNFTGYSEIMVEENIVATDYEPYKSQTAYFPLSEGQKLMEGSYLADDGVHNKKGKTIIDGTSINNDSNTVATNEFGHTYFVITNGSAPNAKKGKYIAPLCTIAKGTSNGGYRLYNSSLICQWGDTSAGFVMALPTSVVGSTLESVKTYLNENPFEVEYELAKEETVPYTEEQQKAWEKIKALMTYKNVTNITSDAPLEVIYIKEFDEAITEVQPKINTLITNLESNKIYRGTIAKNTSFVLPTEIDNTKLNSIELQITISNYENITIDLGTTKYFGDIPELDNGSYILYYEYDGTSWCVGALNVTSEV